MKKKKRMTTADREIAERQDLHRRIVDIVHGACGRQIEGVDEEWFTPTDLSRLIPALEVSFAKVEVDGEGNSHTRNSYLFKPFNLDHFESIGSITDFFFEHGVRA